MVLVYRFPLKPVHDFLALWAQGLQSAGLGNHGVLEIEPVSPISALALLLYPMGLLSCLFKTGEAQGSALTPDCQMCCQLAHSSTRPVSQSGAQQPLVPLGLPEGYFQVLSLG